MMINLLNKDSLTECLDAGTYVLQRMSSSDLVKRIWEAKTLGKKRGDRSELVTVRWARFCRKGGKQGEVKKLALNRKEWSKFLEN